MPHATTRPWYRLWPFLVWMAIAAAFTISVAGSNAIKAHPEPVGLTFWYSGAEWIVYGALATLVIVGLFMLYHVLHPLR